MTRYGWRSEPSVRDWLFAEPYRFEFTQAIRLLEQIAQREYIALGKSLPEALGEGPDPLREGVRLRSAISFSFPPQEVASARQARHKGMPHELVANFFSLAGGQAPMPDWVAELLLQQEQMHDTGLRDFFDIFHHRLLSLLYRIRLHHQPWLDPSLNAAVCEPKTIRTRNRMARNLLVFAGLGLPELQNRLGIGDEEILPYTGLLWQKPRSMAGLQCILVHALHVKVRSIQMIGCWRRIEPEDRTLLGSNRVAGSLEVGRNCVLGQTATLGGRYWDANGQFLLILGPLTLTEFMSLLPIGKAYRTLCELIRFYTGARLQAHARLVLCGPQVPRLRLNRARLGWTTWLGSQHRMGDRAVSISCQV